MRQAQQTRIAALIALAGLTWGSGCIHNHYYGYPAGQAVSACDPQVGTITASIPAVGTVCEVSPGSSGAMVAQNTPISGRATPILSNASRSPGRVIVSQPLGGNLAGRNVAWKRRDPESLATTRTEGAYEDGTEVR